MIYFELKYNQIVFIYLNTVLNVFIYFDAVLMGDEMSAETIMALDEPQKMKKQGRFVKNFNQELWNDVRQEIVETGNMAKVL